MYPMVDKQGKELRFALKNGNQHQKEKTRREKLAGWFK